MKAAITADVHLTNLNHPERCHALEDILDKLKKENINTIIIAGDLFNEKVNNYSEFEHIAADNKYKHIMFHVIPGNHDFDVKQKSITSKNVKIYSESTIKKLDHDDSGLWFFFLPYQKDKVMGEVIASTKSQLPPDKWILIGHGDWESGIKTSNPLEPGVYMPLSQKDINEFKPARVFLGHIHKPMDDGRVCYPGSPCGLDITEIGKRRFLVFDTDNGTVEEHQVDTKVIYFSGEILVLPVEDENTYVKEKINEMIKGWNIKQEEKDKVRLRIKVKGYSTNKSDLKEVVTQQYEDYQFYKEEEVDVFEVNDASDNYELEEIVKKTAGKIKKITGKGKFHQLTHDDILFHALKLIYGEK